MPKKTAATMSGAVSVHAPSAWSVTRQSASAASNGRVETSVATSSADIRNAGPPKRSFPRRRYGRMNASWSGNER